MSEVVKENKLDLKSIMNDWIHKAGMFSCFPVIYFLIFRGVYSVGYPIVYARVNGDRNSVQLTQEHASLDINARTKV
jgi:hypothetical protein